MGHSKLTVGAAEAEVVILMMMIHRLTLRSIYLESRNTELGVRSNLSYEEPLLAIVVVSTVGYQPVTTHCDSFVQKQQNNMSTEVEEYSQFD